MIVASLCFLFTNFTNHAATDYKRRKGDDGLQMNQPSLDTDDALDNLPILDVIELIKTDADQCDGCTRRKCPVHHDTFMFDYCNDESIQEHEADFLLSRGFLPYSKCFQVQSEIEELMAPNNQAEAASEIPNEDQPTTSPSSSTVKRIRDDSEDETEYNLAPVCKKRKQTKATMKLRAVRMVKPNTKMTMKRTTSCHPLPTERNQNSRIVNELKMNIALPVKSSKPL